MTNQENNEIIDVLLERPTNINIGSRFFSIAPLCLGKYLLMQKYASMLKINISGTPQESLLKSCMANPELASNIVAILITDKKEDIFKNDYINSLSKFVLDNLNISDIATLLEMYFEMKPVTAYFKMLGIDKEKERIRKIQKAKDESSSVIVGGVSMFGSLIDAACERYKWTYDYVVWGISYNALQLIMADSIQSIYLSEKERSKAHISTDGINIKGDDPNNRELIKQLLKSR